MLTRVVLASMLSVLVMCNPYRENDNEDENLAYNFGYAVRDETSAHFRKESADEFGDVRGSYGFTDENGIRREVHYVADHNGFRAEIKTNEPGTISGNSAGVNYYSSGHHPDGFQQFRERF